MIDKILVLISLVSLAVFCSVVIVWVAEPDLAVVVLMILALASHDFWISVFRKAQPTHLDPDAALEQRYTGVSGKPLDTAKELEDDVERSVTAKTPPRKKPAARSRTRGRKK